MYAVIDCDNCYVSCERVFRPDLNGKPVVVLSNNDGCVVARSKEAKLMGIKAGTPYYQLKDLFPGQEIHCFSSNYELYGDLTARVMSIVRKASPEFWRYSIDEAFVELKGMEHIELKKWGEDLHKQILKWVGIPVSIGIAPTKTLAKCADRFAKDYPGYNHCCVIDSEEKRVKALKLFEIGEVWGIGRRFKSRLEDYGVATAFDFISKPQSWVKHEFHLPGERTWMELNGIDCIPMEDTTTKKSICTSRSFPSNIGDIETVRTHVSNFAARCAEKLRRQNTVCSLVTVFVHTNRFREDLPQYGNSISVSLLTPDNSTQVIVSKACEALAAIWRPYFQYKKAGVIVSDIQPSNAVQTNFLDFDDKTHEKLQRLDSAIDRINRLLGDETIVLGAQQYPLQKEPTDTKNTTNPHDEKIRGKSMSFRDAIKHEFRSKNYTTRWSDLLDTK